MSSHSQPMIRTRVNNPERVYLNSSDDPRTYGDQGFSQFQVTFDTPILGAKKTMMLRASIPNAAPASFPDYACTFWYYSLPTATSAPGTVSLRCIRLYASYFQAPSGYTTFVRNRIFNDPADFVAALNTAAAAGGDLLANNPYWVAGDVSFAYNATTKQITMTGGTAGRFYTPAGWNDPLVQAALDDIVVPNVTGVGTTVQPFINQYTMNLRVGYAMSGQSFGFPGNRGATANPAYANVTNTTYANGTAIPADSFPNLVFTQCIYLYSNIVAGVSLGSNKTHNLLSVVPVNAPPLGIAQYTALTVNMMSKIVDTIYEIQVEMRDDNNQPFVLPDAAQVNIELAFVYTE